MFRVLCFHDARKKDEVTQWLQNQAYNHFVVVVFVFFSVRLLSVLRGHSFFSSPPQRPMTSDFERFSIPDFIHYTYFPILIVVIT